MLLSHDDDPTSYWPIKELPKHPSDEYTFKVMAKGTKDSDALAVIAKAQRKYMAKGYKIIGGQRAASPMVVFKGKRMTLADVVRGHANKVKYLTVYRRIERGWTLEQALGIDPPAPRWHQQKQAERKARETERAAA
jgi:hypothetical protein